MLQDSPEMVQDSEEILGGSFKMINNPQLLMLLLLMLLMLLLLMLDWSRGHETAAAIPARMQIQPGEDQDEAGPDADAPHGASGILQRLGSPQRGHPAPPVLRERPPSAGLRPSRPQSRPHPDGSPRSGHRQAIHGPARQFHDL